MLPAGGVGAGAAAGVSFAAAGAVSCGAMISSFSAGAAGGVDVAIDEHNQKLVTPDMRKAVEEARAAILSGKIKVIDYMANNACR